MKKTIVICGCERSGTTAVASLLAAGTGKQLLDDPPEAWHLIPKVKMILEEPDALCQFLKPDTIVKVPGFAAVIEEVNSFTPHVQFVVVIRDPRDVVSSMLERLSDRPGPLFLWTEWLNVQASGLVDRLAGRWCKYIEMASASSHKCGNVTFINYEDFVKDKILVLRELAELFGNSFHNGLVKDQLEFQFRKEKNHTIQGPGRYVSDLTEKDQYLIINRCAKLMIEYGYDDHTITTTCKSLHSLHRRLRIAYNHAAPWKVRSIPPHGKAIDLKQETLNKSITNSPIMEHLVEGIQ